MSVIKLQAHFNLCSACVWHYSWQHFGNIERDSWEPFIFKDFIMLALYQNVSSLSCTHWHGKSEHVFVFVCLKGMGCVLLPGVKYCSSFQSYTCGSFLLSSDLSYSWKDCGLLSNCIRSQRLLLVPGCHAFDRWYKGKMGDVTPRWSLRWSRKRARFMSCTLSVFLYKESNLGQKMVNEQESLPINHHSQPPAKLQSISKLLTWTVCIFPHRFTLLYMCGCVYLCFTERLAVY